ncbi:MAG: hypothetical protein JWM93_18 [Frankiales bacterium]|nr:hypothetical protein [Frankiales bacterium]
MSGDGNDGNDGNDQRSEADPSVVFDDSVNFPADDEAAYVAASVAADEADDVAAAAVAGDPSAAELPDVVNTGEYRVDVALSRLQELDGIAVGEHVAVFDDVHAQLQGALADLDER